MIAIPFVLQGHLLDDSRYASHNIGKHSQYVCICKYCKAEDVVHIFVSIYALILSAL